MRILRKYVVLESTNVSVSADIEEDMRILEHWIYGKIPENPLIY